MNSHNSVNNNNLMNFSTGLSTLNQLDPKDELARFPFDHIYACHSVPERTNLPLDKQVEQASRLVVTEKEDNHFNFNKSHEQVNALEVKNKRLNDLLIYHLELVQQQNEAITKKDKLYQVLKLENNALKAKLVSTVGINTSDAPDMTYHPPEPTSTVTSETINQKSQILDFCPAITSHKSPEIKKELKEIVEHAQISAQDIGEEANTRGRTCPDEMIGSKRPRTKAALPAACRKAQVKPRRAVNRKPSPKNNSRVQRKKQKSTSKTTRCSSKQQVDTSQGETVEKSCQSPVLKKTFKYKPLESQSDCAQIMAPTLKSDDPYQPDFQEEQQKPILKRKGGSILYGNKKKKVMPEEMVPHAVEVEVNIGHVTTDIGREEVVEYVAPNSESHLEEPFVDVQTLSTSSQGSTHHEQNQELASTSRARNRTCPVVFFDKSKMKTNRGRKRKAKWLPTIGLASREPFHTLIGDPDCDWGMNIGTEVNSEIFDPDLAFLNDVEVPKWRVNLYDPDNHCVCAEFVNDETFEKRHNKHEIEERRQLRWHMRRIREQRHMERLRLRHKDSWSNMPVSPPSVYTLWPRAQRDLHELHIALTLPVGAFGEDIPDLPQANFMLPWVCTSKALKRTKRSKTLR